MKKQQQENNLPPELDFDVDLFLDRSTVLYGESGSGKTSIIKDVLHLLKNHIKQIIVISPTDPQNGSYSKNNTVPLPCIHYTLTETLLKDIWERQEALSATYKTVHDINILDKLFRRLNLSERNSDIERIKMAKLDAIEKIRDQNIDQSKKQKEIEKVEEDYQKFFLKFYKHHIIGNYRYLQQLDLTEEEKFSLKYIGINPRKIIIFDDCTDQIKALNTEGKSYLQKLFFAGRWNFLTFIIAAHDDKALTTEMRKSSYVSFFCNSISATSYFHKQTNGQTRAIAKKINDWIDNKKLFDSNDGHQKLVYIRQKNEFFVYTAKFHEEFEFIDGVLKRFFNEIKKDGRTVNPNNRFYKIFSNSRNGS